MRLRVLPMVVVLLVTCAVPRDAAADRLGFFRWWDSLSGPGGWYGFTYELQFGTWAIHRDQVTTQQVQRVFFDPTGMVAYPKRYYVNFGAEVGSLWTSDGDLDYAPGVDPPNAYALPVLATADFGKHGVEGGLGLGFLRLSGVNSSSWHFVFEPRVTFKPLVFFNRHADSKEWHEMFAARFYLTRVGEIDPVQFGAIGPPDAGGEWVPGFSMSINLLAIKRKIEGK